MSRNIEIAGIISFGGKLLNVYGDLDAPLFKAMKRVKVATHEELEILQKSVDGILSFVLDIRNIFGYDCFVEETEEEIKIVRKLYDLLVFSMEPDDLNEQLKELESEDPKTCTFIYRFIKTKLNK